MYMNVYIYIYEELYYIENIYYFYRLGNRRKEAERI